MTCLPAASERIVHGVVHRVRQADVDRVDTRVGEEGVVRAVRGRNAAARGLLPSPLRVATADGDDLDRSGPPGTRQEPIEDPAGPEDPEPDEPRSHRLKRRVAGHPDAGRAEAPPTTVAATRLSALRSRA